MGLGSGMDGQFGDGLWVEDGGGCDDDDDDDDDCCCCCCRCDWPWVGLIAHDVGCWTGMDVKIISDSTSLATDPVNEPVWQTPRRIKRVPA